MATATNRILWWSLVLSLVIYVGVAAQAGRAEPVDVSALLPVFVAISVGIGAGTFLHRRRFLSEPIQSGRLDPTTPEGQQQAFKVFMIDLVLSESVGIYGLVLSILSGRLWYSVAFSAAAIGLLVIHRPTAPDLVPPSPATDRSLDSTPIA
jgi:hypothetical protein